MNTPAINRKKATIERKTPQAPIIKRSRHMAKGIKGKQLRFDNCEDDQD